MQAFSTVSLLKRDANTGVVKFENLLRTLFLQKTSGGCFCRVSIRVIVSSDESKLKPVIVFYPRFCNVWFKEYLFSTRGEACKSKKSINCLCFILSFYYNVSLLEEMLIFVKRSLTKKLWIRGDKNFVFFIFFFIFPFPCFYKSLQWKHMNRT